MHHYFLENEDIASLSNEVFKLEFSEDDKRHLKAQRLEVGEHITAVDRSKNYFELEIVDREINHIRARIALKKDFAQKDYQLYLFQGVSKNAKLDDVLRATTEIGIDRFFAVNMNRSVATIKEASLNKKLERFSSIVKSASMQSGRKDIPEVSVLRKFDEVLSYLDNLDLMLVFWERASASDTVEIALKHFKPLQKIGILIGPEGGISKCEIDGLMAFKNVRFCTLGETILRTETAGIVASAIVKHVLDQRS